jgi:hypothetical protein
MIRPLVDEKEINEAFAVFSSHVTEGGKQVQSVVGYQGGNEAVTLTWHADKKLWVLLEPERLINRFWCAFGTDNPATASMVSIACEINPPRIGFNRRCAGLFISDSTGAVHLAHSGKVGGGRAGIGKTAFLSSRDKNDIVPVIFPDGQKFEYIVIGRIDDGEFLADLAKFVHAVAEFKQEAVIG